MSDVTTQEIRADSLVCGDCLELLQGVTTASVDLILCDLPYEVLNKRNASASWDKMLPLDELWKHYERVIKPNGAIVLFGQGLFTDRLCLSNEKMFKYRLVWCKGSGVTGFLNANRQPMRNHEDICVFYKKQCKYNPQYTSGQVNHARGGASNGYKATGNAQNRCYGGFKNTPTVFTNKKYPKSVIFFGKQKNFHHPTEKPIDLLSWLIKTYTDKGDLVLDNTMGSGSTCVAAVRNKRRYIGIEKDPKFFEIAEKRVREAEIDMATDLFNTL